MDSSIYSERSNIPSGFDFSEILPLFIDYIPPDYKQQNIKYDFGIGDIRFVPNLDKFVELATQKVVQKAAGLTMILPGMQGYESLCELLAEIVQNETGLSTDRDNIVITDGGCDGIALSALAICNPGDGVAYAVPAFPYWSVLYPTGVVQYPIVCWPPTNYCEKFALLLQETIDKHANIKAIIINEPQNPIGRPLYEHQLKLIADLAEKRELFLILDDVGRLFAPTEEKWWGQYFAPEKCFIVDSFTKRFALPGLRLGFVRAEKESISALRALVANMRGGIGNFHSFFALQLLHELQSAGELHIVKNEISRRMENLCDGISRNRTEGLDFTCSHRGMYALVEINMYEIISNWDSKGFQKYLLEKGVRILTGSFMFPNLTPNDPKNWIIRLSVGAERQVLEGIEYLFSILESMIKASP